VQNPSLDEELKLGVKDEDLSSFAMDILSFSDEVSKIFSSIDSKMNELKNYFSGARYDNLMSAYNSFKPNYSIVKDDIISYSDDLITLINKSIAGDKQIAFLINKVTDIAKEETEKVNNL
jgi:hypothetical protein